jgi:hypothetical protein
MKKKLAGNVCNFDRPFKNKKTVNRQKSIRKLYTKFNGASISGKSIYCFPKFMKFYLVIGLFFSIFINVIITRAFYIY